MTTAKYGLEMTSFILENVSLPPEVEAAIDKRSSMAAVGNLNDYVKFQMAQGMASGRRRRGRHGHGDGGRNGHGAADDETTGGALGRGDAGGDALSPLAHNASADGAGRASQRRPGAFRSFLRQPMQRRCWGSRKPTCFSLSIMAISRGRNRLDLEDHERADQFPEQLTRTAQTRSPMP